MTLEEALTAFRDPLARIFDDPDHSSEEPREIIVGHSEQQHLLLVCFTERRGTVRIINARYATKGERRTHHTSIPRRGVPACG